jgi:hypothetical protein
MATTEAFVDRIREYLLSLPFDLKVLQEAVTDPDLDRTAREIAAGTIIHTLLPQEGEAGPLRFVDDALLVRAALERAMADGGDGVTAFRERFATEIYGKLADDLALFSASLGDLWPWLTGKLPGFSKLAYKGKKPSQFVDDDEAASFLYEEGLEFQTNYNVTEEQVRNRLRRPEQILEVLQKRRSEELKKKS